MSGKFIASGTIDKPIERDDAWVQAERELEERRAERERNKAAHDGKTLFEVLQANKAAKEEAFQESIKLKNQFRALNDDEVDFLDAHATAQRAKEEAVRQETNEQLQAFRMKQEAANRPNPALGEDDGPDPELTGDLAEANWATFKKRKRIKGGEPAKALKVRRGSSDVPLNLKPRSGNPVPKQEGEEILSRIPQEKSQDSKSIASAPEKKGLGLVSYGSDDESE